MLLIETGERALERDKEAIGRSRGGAALVQARINVYVTRRLLLKDSFAPG